MILSDLILRNTIICRIILRDIKSQEISQFYNLTPISTGGHKEYESLNHRDFATDPGLTEDKFPLASR